MMIFETDIIGKTFYRGNRVFIYGMKTTTDYPMRGLIRIELDTTDKYLCILVYNFPLNDHEQDENELTYLGERTE